MKPLVSIRQFESKSVLMEYLRQASGQKIVLGDRAQSPGEFYCIHIDSSDARMFIGVLSDGIDEAPKWIVKQSTVLIGFNDEIAMFPMSTPGYKEVNLSDQFIEFLDAEVPHTCVLCLASIVALDAAGSILWYRTTDWIIDTSVTDRIVSLTLMDDPAVKVDLMSGDILPDSPPRR